jgi:hypothetical protein
LIYKIINSLKKRVKFYKEILLQYSDEKTIFIYQMGKVGSTSLELALPNAVHVHAFYSKNHTCPVRLKGLAKFGFKHFIYRVEQELLALLLRRAFKSRTHTKIITLVRDPQARNISMFFHDLDAYLFAAHTNCLNTREAPLPTRCQNADVLVDIFNQEFDHQYALNWFDEEFIPMTGIDVYCQAFNKEDGFTFLENDKTSVLCIRTDKLSTCTEQIKQFTGENIELQYENKAEGKWYESIYRHFKSAYEYEPDLLAKQKTSKFYKHFFD